VTPFSALFGLFSASFGVFLILRRSRDAFPGWRDASSHSRDAFLRWRDAFCVGVTLPMTLDVETGAR
jgi:hypothetical protein